MLTPQFLLGLHHELVVDNFAGGGGASTGIERALGRPVDHAINHDRIALGMHRINHPQTVHHCEDVFDIDPRTITEGRPVCLGWFSPDSQHNGGFNTTEGHDAREPVSTISSKGSQQQVVAASLIRQFGASIGQEVDSPAPTVVAGGGGKTGVIAASVAVYHGTEEDGHGADEPAHTATTRNRLGVVQSQLVNPLTPQQEAGALRVAAFLREHGIEFEGPYAMVAGYVIVDLGMRMLTPRELFLAQGFPPDYVIDRAWLIDAHTGELTEVTLTKEQQIRMCGNSVCPPEAEDLVRANLPELCLGHPSLSKPRRQKAALSA